jgi:ectoine hydroxylase-related dioxygenase (phytanoyl-CoA dioxygenase family)
MYSVNRRTDSDWLTKVLEGVRQLGYAVVEGVVPDALLSETRDALYRVQDLIRAEVGEDRLVRAGELGVQRLALKYDPVFFKYIESPEVLAVIDATVSSTAVLHLQNGFILPPQPAEVATDTFQQSFHRDFPRDLNGYLGSVNTLFAVDDFSAENGGTLVVPGTHQRAEPPAQAFLDSAAVAVECPAGSMLVFDSTLWHAAGKNRSAKDRLAINQQFTRSFFKQQIDYVRALGDDVVEAQEPRTQQILGWYTRVVTSLDEYYRPTEARLYRAGQG